MVTSGQMQVAVWRKNLKDEWVEESFTEMEDWREPGLDKIGRFHFGHVETTGLHSGLNEAQILYVSSQGIQ